MSASMSIEDILEIMDETLDRAMQVPFSNKKSLVDVDKIRELIQEIRINMPLEIKQAQKVVNDRKSVIEKAKSDAERTLKEAEEKRRILVDQQEITRLAQQKANEIILAAQQKSNQIRNSTNDFVDAKLAEIEELLSHDLVNIKKARNTLRASK